MINDPIISESDMISVYSITGNITDINTLLINRNVLRELLKKANNGTSNDIRSSD